MSDVWAEAKKKPTEKWAFFCVIADEVLEAEASASFELNDFLSGDLDELSFFAFFSAGVATHSFFAGYNGERTETYEGNFFVFLHGFLDSFDSSIQCFLSVNLGKACFFSYSIN